MHAALRLSSAAVRPTRLRCTSGQELADPLVRAALPAWAESAAPAESPAAAEPRALEERQALGARAAPQVSLPSLFVGPLLMPDFCDSPGNCCETDLNCAFSGYVCVDSGCKKDAGAPIKQCQPARGGSCTIVDEPCPNSTDYECITSRRADKPQTLRPRHPRLRCQSTRLTIARRGSPVKVNPALAWIAASPATAPSTVQRATSARPRRLPVIAPARTGPATRTTDCWRFRWQLARSALTSTTTGPRSALGSSAPRARGVSTQTAVTASAPVCEMGAATRPSASCGDYGLCRNNWRMLTSPVASRA